MLLRDTIRIAFGGITVNRTRSMLTMLGIIIGVGSVVLMVSIGNSFQNYILDQIESIGTGTVDVFPTGLEKFGKNLDSLTLDDFEEVQKLSTVSNAAPIILISRPVAYGKEEVSPMVMGTRREIFANYGLKLESGRMLEPGDDEGAKFVAVLSYQTALDLFGNVDPLGKKIKIGEFPFTVVGVLQSMGSLLLSDLDKPVYVPFSTARAVTGQKYLTYMTLKAVGDPAIATEDVKLLLRQQHRIDNPEDDPDKDDFIARSSEQVTGIVNSVTLGLTVFLSLVAAISLLVGGIGIMNIMLVSVTVRTREIGRRKAVGARKIDILLQFLFEAVSLTVTGGAIGILGGGGLGWLLAKVASSALGPVPYSMSLSSILMALGMAVGIGLVFGIFPAKRAANLSPMEALRYE